MRLAKTDGVETTIVLRLFLFDDVGLDGNANVIGLAGEICGHMIVDAIMFECGVTEIGPEDRYQTQFMRTLESLADLLDLATAFRSAEIHGGTDGNST